MRSLVFAALVALVALPAAADEPIIKLKPGPGLDQVEGNCGACHSLDYIQMNSPFLNAAQWNAEVTKMIKAFGAPISDADAKAIADYLAKNYGS
ncbi:MAG TPA: cytochrome c [Xanthobacteraceae bacterium]|nr:cytochrome c [Xanthobacteraceae bacterium]